MTIRIPPITAPTLEWVLAADGDYLYKPGSRELAELLKKAIGDLHSSVGDVSKKIYDLAVDQKLPAADIIKAQVALAEITDATEEASAEVIKAILGRVEAFVAPPPGEATAAVITAGEPVTKAEE